MDAIPGQRELTATGFSLPGACHIPFFVASSDPRKAVEAVFPAPGQPFFLSVPAIAQANPNTIFLASSHPGGETRDIIRLSESFRPVQTQDPVILRRFKKSKEDTHG